jgi:hypothetical protein
MGTKIDRFIMEINGDTFDFEAMKRRFPWFCKRLLFELGERGALGLLDYIEKSGIKYKGDGVDEDGIPVSKTNKRMVSYYANDKYVKIRSFPLKILRTGHDNPRTSKRTQGPRLLRTFGSGFNAQGATEEAIKKLTDEDIKIEIVKKIQMSGERIKLL